MCLQTEHWTPSMILDDGGDATHRLMTKFPQLAKGMEGIVEESVIGIHRLYQLSKEGQLPMPAINIHDSVVKVIGRYLCIHVVSRLEALLNQWLCLLCICSECMYTTHHFHFHFQTKFDNLYSCRESVIDR